jgi:hypothetical protein
LPLGKKDPASPLGRHFKNKHPIESEEIRKRLRLERMALERKLGVFVDDPHRRPFTPWFRLMTTKDRIEIAIPSRTWIPR